MIHFYEIAAQYNVVLLAPYGIDGAIKVGKRMDGWMDGWMDKQIDG
jgi:hypothetical protein